MAKLLDILAVEDNADDLAFLGIAIEWSGLNICHCTARNGQQAIDFLQGRGEYADRSKYPLPQVVVLDLAMPGSSGFDFLSWRGASEDFRSLPVIVFTNSSDPGTIERAYAMGVNRCVTKPGRIEDWTALARQCWELGVT